MGIVFCIFKFFPFGGLQRDFLRIACECRDRGYKIIVYTFSWEGLPPPHGFEIRIVPNYRFTNHGKASFFSKWILKESIKNYYQAIVGFNRIKGLDIYFAGDNCIREYGFTKKNILYRIVPRFLAFTYLEKSVFKPSAKTEILILTKKQEYDYIKHYHTQKERFHLLPPSISSKYKYPLDAKKIRNRIRASLNVTDDTIVLVQIGSSGFITKGVDFTIKAIASLPLEIRNKVILLVIGNDNQSYFLRLSKRLGVIKQVYFLGGRDDVFNILLASDLMVHPARNEATGTVLIEALVAQLPVLCSSECGYSSYIKDLQCGKTLSYPFNQEELNKTLLALLQNKNTLPYLGQRGGEITKNINLFNRHIIAADIIEKNINTKLNKIFQSVPKYKSKTNSPPVRYLYLREDFKKFFNNKNPFEEVDKLKGRLFRLIKNRRTLQFELNGKRFFVKIHHSIGWREIFKNLLQFKRPVIGAGNEWAAINKLNELKVDTMTACAFGQRGKNPAKQESFIITETLENTISLEDFCKNWKTSPPVMSLKYTLIKKVAWVSRQLHTNGINHRDYYICHFLMDISCGFENITYENLKLHLIDLHRTRIRKKTPYRWIIKDVAGIWFSSMDIGLTKKDCFRFMKIYSNSSLRNTLTKDRSFWVDVNNTARRLYKKDHGRKPNIEENYD